MMICFCYLLFFDFSVDDALYFRCHLFPFSVHDCLDNPFLGRQLAEIFCYQHPCIFSFFSIVHYRFLFLTVQNYVEKGVRLYSKSSKIVVKIFQNAKNGLFCPFFCVFFCFLYDAVG